MRTSPDIFDFEDMSAFLKVWFEHAKSTRLQMSYELAGRRLGINRGHVASLVNGHRKVPDELVPRLASLLGIGPDEEDYLGLMCELQRVRTDSQRADVRGRLSAMRQQHAAHRIDTDRRAAMEHWYIMAIRSLARLPSFRTDPAWIASVLEPPITEAQAAEGLAVLDRLGIDIAARVTTGMRDIRGVSRTYHAQMIGHAASCMDRFPMQEREVQGITCALSERSFESLRAEIRRAVEAWMALADDVTDPDRVIQVCVQAFPLAQPEKR